MFSIKKIFIIALAFLLVFVFVLSILNRNMENVYAGASSQNGYSGIGLPAEGEELLNQKHPIKAIYNQTSFDYVGDVCYVMYVLNNQYIRYDQGLYKQVNGTDFELNGNEYAPVLFGKVDTEGFSFSDYSHLKIEFDVYDDDSTLSNLGCSFHLIGRDGKNLADKAAISNVDVTLNGTKNSFTAVTYNDKELNAKKFNVKYVIEFDREKSKISRMQVFLNDILYEDTVLTKNEVFSNRSIDRFTGISIRNFYSEADTSSIAFSNLVVTGYNEVR